MTLPMAQGLQGHKVLEEDFKKDAVEITLEDFLRDGGMTREMALKCEIHQLRGIIDELVITKDKIMIFDDKKNAKAWPSYIKQLHAYALMVQEELLNDRPIILSLRDLHSGVVVWSDEFRPEHKVALVESLQRIRDVIEGKVEARHTDNPKICAACSLNCKFRVVKSKA